MVEPIRMTTREEREAAIRTAGYNTFLLRSDDVYIDLLTDSGTSAMSDNQWSGLMLGDEAYAGSPQLLPPRVDAVREVYGYEELIPTHQGRGAEHILSQILISPGDVIPGNMYFTTTKFHQEYAGGRFVDVIIDEAHDPYSDHPFKGNVDLDKLQRVIDEVGADRIPYISVETNVNMAGGQPMSMANLAEVYELCRRHGILVMLDATRALENAWFIKQREPGYQDRSVGDPARDLLVLRRRHRVVEEGQPRQHRGFLALRDPDLARKARALLVAFEGSTPTAGCRVGTWRRSPGDPGDGRDRRPRAARVGQVEYLGTLIEGRGAGGAADRRPRRVPRRPAILEHLPQSELPAQALAAALYLDSGVRGWSGGWSRRDAIPRPATTTTRSSSWSGSPSPAGSTPRRTWTWWPSRWSRSTSGVASRWSAVHLRARGAPLLPGPLRAHHPLALLSPIRPTFRPTQGWGTHGSCSLARG
jgi:tyrosine phenol-lyase